MALAREGTSGALTQGAFMSNLSRISRPVRLLLGIPILALPLFCVAQAGHLDPSFGSGGIVQTSFGSGNTFAVSGAALAPNGNIVVSGTITVTSTSAVSSAVVRYLPSGALDSTFGKGGILTLPAPAALP